ncbi:MAG: GDSL-type esterase/lipase family protein [Cyanobacteria bacterium P01_F01_bin.150]
MPTVNSSVLPSSVPDSLNASTLERLQERLLQQRHPGVPLKIVALGDSLIYGFGDPIQGGWVEQLRRQWMATDSPGHVMYNLGIRGDGVKQVCQRLDAEFHCRGELRHRVPDVILLSVGTNDSARLGRLTGKQFTPFEQFEVDLAKLLDRAQHLCPVLYVGMPPVDQACMPFAGCMYYNHADQRVYKNLTKQGCQTRNIPYLDIFDLWIARGDAWWRSRLCADGIHPNSEGYRSLLEDVQNWSAFQHLLA